MSRRLRVDRSFATQSALNKEQQFEVRAIVEEATRDILCKHADVRAELNSAKVYIHNMSTILRDIQNSVIMAKYGTGSTKSVLSELLQMLELSMENVQYLPPPYAVTEPADWGDVYAANGALLPPSSVANRTYPPINSVHDEPRERDGPDDQNRSYGEYDPVEDVSDF